MTKFSNGKSVLQELNPEIDDSDIDFGDVFGGPPRRRTSAHELMRYGLGESAADSGGEVNTRGGGRWSEVNEKPVFGEESTSNRRRLTTDGFFNDIFGGKETSSSSSPRRRSEAFGSNLAGSRVLSPAPPLTPKAETFGASSPPQFSLPAKLTKQTDLPTFGSPALPLNKNLDAALNGSGTYSYSPLSRSSSLLDLNQSQEDATDGGSTAKRDADEVQGKGSVSSRKGLFHFSFYRWPNKGVIPTLVMPLGRVGSSRFRVKFEPRKVDDVRFSDLDDEVFRSTRRGVGGYLDVKDKETEHDVLSEQRLSGETAEDASGDLSEVYRLKLNSLRSFLFDNDDDGQDADEVEEREDKSKAKNRRHSSGDYSSKKKPDKRRSSSDSTKSAEPGFLGSSSTPGEVGKNGVKGKVREFAKIFSQGASILTGGDSLGQSSRWRGKENTVIDVNKTANVDQAEQMSGEPKKESPDSPAVGRKPSRVSEKHSSVRNMKNRGSYSVSGQEAQVTPADTDDPFQVNFQVREITEDEIKLEQLHDDPEEIQIIDANIRKWSNGKAGNIRSLLSTLQYILWPESGWKPVPLMEMIEGNAVRKSYQKALLILHPDKLQQRGASANQKYIAERVFKLLQEAWEHFNFLGPL